MIERFFDYICTPDAYHGRPWPYLANQIGHMVLGAAAALLVSPPEVLALIVLYVLLIELPQAISWGGAVSDGIEDTGHVTAGALAVATGWPALAVSALMIAAGVAWRHEQNQTSNQRRDR